MNAIERLREALPPEPVMPDHDPMCRVYSGWPEIAAKGCNCSVAARAAGRDALAAVEALYQAAKELVRDGHQSADNPMNYIASNGDAEDLAAAVRRIEGE